MNHLSPCWITAAVIGVAVAVAADAETSAVHTPDAAVRGAVAFDDGAVRVGDQRISWQDVVALTTHPGLRTLPSPNTVWLRDGQRWIGRVHRFQAGRLTIELPGLGRRMISQDQLLAIDFRTRLAPPTATDAGRLVRSEGEPLPGELLWVRDEQASVDSILGVLTLQHDALVRYVFPESEASKPSEAVVVHLVTGTRLIGSSASPIQDALRLNHPQLGPIEIPANTIRSVERSASNVVRLLDQTPIVRSAALLAPLDSPVQPVRRVPFDEAVRVGATAALHMEPESSATFPLPADDRQTLRIELRPIARASVAARLRIRVADRVLLDRTVAPDATPELVSLDVAGVSEATVSVDFADWIGFPVGVLLVEPRVVTDGGE